MKRLWVNLTARVKQRVQESVMVKIALALSIALVFGTTYVLILPALTISTDNRSAVMQRTESVSDETSLSQQESSAESPQVEGSNTEQRLNEQKESSKPSVNQQFSQSGRLQASADNVVVTVDFTAGTFAEPVSLVVQSVGTTEKINQRLSTVLRETKQSLSKALSYDISFRNASGQEVEPQKEVTVSLQFNAAITSSKLQSSWKLYHFIGNDINHVEDLTHESDTNIEWMDFLNL
jgi:hypothetical protein